MQLVTIFVNCRIRSSALFIPATALNAAHAARVRSGADFQRIHGQFSSKDTVGFTALPGILDNKVETPAMHLVLHGECS